MKVAVAGASGFVGSNLVPRLLEDGHEVVALDLQKPEYPAADNREVNLRDEEKLRGAFEGIDAVYYLVHGMTGRRNFREEEIETARVFRRVCEEQSVQQVIYLTGIVNTGAKSEHLASRRQVGTILEEGDYAYTELRAAMILGEGSASYEMMKDIVDRLPLMVIPRWLMSESQPIYIGDVIEYLSAVLGEERSYGKKFDIGGPEKLSYSEILQRYADLRGLKRYFIPVPFLTPRLSSYWLYLVTDQDRSLTSSLVQSLEYDLPVENPVARSIIAHEPLSFEEAIQRIEDGNQNHPESSV